MHIAEDWYRRTALCDLLQLGDEEVNKDRLYWLDHLLAQKAALEGQAEANPQARRGYSRDHRPDCKKVCIGLVSHTQSCLIRFRTLLSHPLASRRGVLSPRLQQHSLQFGLKIRQQSTLKHSL
jgi:hypothetical protein